MADESTNISNIEQFVIWIRCFHEKLIGLHSVNVANTSNFSDILNDVILRLGVDKRCLQGQCYGEYSIMMGKVPAVAQIIKQDVNHRTFTIHCFCYSFSLACNDTIKNSAIMRNSLKIAFEKAKFIQTFAHVGIGFDKKCQM